MGVVTDFLTAITGDDTKAKDSTGASNQKQTGTVKDTTDQFQQTDTTTQSGSVTAGHTDQSTSTSGKTQTLSNTEIQISDQLLKTIGAQGPTDLSGLAQRISGNNDATSQAIAAMLQRAGGAEASLNAGTDKILAASRQEGVKARDAKTTQAAGAAGSSFNTLVQQVFAQSENELDTSLAALGAQLASSNRTQATQELLSAVDSLQKQSSVISTSEGAVPALASTIDSNRAASMANLLNSLKGGVTTSDSFGRTTGDTRSENQTTTNVSGQTQTNTTQNKDVNLNTNTVSVGSDITKDKTNLLDLLNALKQS